MELRLARVNLEGGVYFLQIKDSDGPIKIGYSADIRRRRLDLLTGIPYDLKLLGYLPNRNYEHESQLHEKFKHLHIRGEWFLPAKELLGYINARCVKGHVLMCGEDETPVPPF